VIESKNETLAIHKRKAMSSKQASPSGSELSSIDDKPSSSSFGDESAGTRASEMDDFVEMEDGAKPRAASFLATMRQEDVLMEDSFQHYGEGFTPTATLPLPLQRSGSSDDDGSQGTATSPQLNVSSCGSKNASPTSTSERKLRTPIEQNAPETGDFANAPLTPTLPTESRTALSPHAALPPLRRSLDDGSQRTGISPATQRVSRSQSPESPKALPASTSARQLVGAILQQSGTVERSSPQRQRATSSDLGPSTKGISPPRKLPPRTKSCESSKISPTSSSWRMRQVQQRIGAGDYGKNLASPSRPAAQVSPPPLEPSHRDSPRSTRDRGSMRDISSPGELGVRRGTLRGEGGQRVHSSMRDISAPGALGVRRGFLHGEGGQPIGRSNLQDLDNYLRQVAKPDVGMHSSVSHLNYHARKREDDGWSDSSDFDLEWKLPFSSKGKKRSESSSGLLDAHLGDGQSGYTSIRPSLYRSNVGHDSIASIDMTIMNESDDLKNKIGDLKVKPVTAASKAAAAAAAAFKDKSASSTIFAQRKQQVVDQSVNLMDAGSQTSSGGSGSKSGRASITESGRHIMSAPSRPKKYPSRPERTDPVSTSFMDAGFMDFLSDSKPDSSGLQHGADPSKFSPTTKVEKGPSTWGRWTVLALLWVVLLATAGAFFLTPVIEGHGGGKETKSGGHLFQLHGDDHFRDGTVILPSHQEQMSETKQQVTALDQKLMELRDLVVQHGISKPEDFRWNVHNDEDDEFMALTPQTKALIWLGHADTIEERDVQHHMLFQRFALAVLYYSTRGKYMDAATILQTANADSFPSSYLDHFKHGSSWLNSYRWLSAKSVCTWYGIECDPDEVGDERIIALNLTHNGLHGTIPWRELTATLQWHLQSVELSGNAIVGDVMGFSGNINSADSVAWPHLRKFRISDNHLTGPLPVHWLRTCQEVEEIDLSGNRFRGSLPDNAFDYFDKLRRLQLDHNDLTGKVPVLGHLQHLGKQVFEAV
jgi:Leucine rich repeat